MKEIKIIKETNPDALEVRVNIFLKTIPHIKSELQYAVVSNNYGYSYSVI